MRVVNVSNKECRPFVGGRLLSIKPWHESPGVEYDGPTSKLVLRLAGASRGWEGLTEEDLNARPLRPDAPGLLDALIAKWKRQPKYLIAGAPAETPSARWTTNAILEYAKGKGVKVGATWSKDRLLRAVLNGPTPADVDALNLEAERRAAAIKAGRRPKAEAPPPDPDDAPPVVEDDDVDAEDDDSEESAGDKE